MTLASEPLPETVNLEFALHFSSIVFHDTSIFYILVFDEINSSSLGVNIYWRPLPWLWPFYAQLLTSFGHLPEIFSRFYHMSSSCDFSRRESVE